MKLRALLTVGFLSLFVALVACSSDTTASGADTCDQASKVADDCNAKPAEGGVKITLTFDKAKCASSDKKAAQCIVDNKTNCDCFIACGVKGTCP
jgi:hypothetical protein